eukprot:scaffold55248_cov65-Attheya_sp.AAC.2
MAIAIHPHSDPSNHLTHLYFLYLLVHTLKVFDGLVTGLLVETMMRVAWLRLGAEYGVSWGSCSHLKDGHGFIKVFNIEAEIPRFHMSTHFGKLGMDE